MSLVNADLINQKEPLAFVLITRHSHRLMGVYLNISQGLKALYLADELAILHVCYLNRTGLACIDDTYDGVIGSFSADQNNNIIYQRHLTKQIESVDNPSLLITPEDFDEINSEYNKSLPPTVIKSSYYSKVIDMVNRAITARFNQLSSLLTNQLIALIEKMNTDYNVEFDFDLMIESNRFYQQSNQQLPTLNLEDKIEMLKKISQLVAKCQNEITTLKQLEKDFTCDDEPASESLIKNDDPSWDELGFEVDWEQQFEIAQALDNNKDKDKHPSSLSQHPLGLLGEKNKKILYDSPPSSPKAQNSLQFFGPKERDPNRQKKTVNFDLEQIQTHIYQNPDPHADPESEGDTL